MATGELTQSSAESDAIYAELQSLVEGDRFRRCLQCSSCSGICPFGYVMDYPPRRILAALRAQSFSEVLQSGTTWMCVSCQACSEVCPIRIPLTDRLMTRVKEELIEAGHVPTELQEALENSQRYGNPLAGCGETLSWDGRSGPGPHRRAKPRRGRGKCSLGAREPPVIRPTIMSYGFFFRTLLGKPRRQRADWIKDLDFPVPIMRQLDRPVVVLWFVGDYASFNPRVKKIGLTLARLLHLLGVDFAMLGPKENSDGYSQRLAGKHGLFEMLAEKMDGRLRNINTAKS
jgi:heterodisulfide reductase subunit C